jgi:hypothetical protein
LPKIRLTWGVYLTNDRAHEIAVINFAVGLTHIASLTAKGIYGLTLPKFATVGIKKGEKEKLFPHTKNNASSKYVKDGQTSFSFFFFFLLRFDLNTARLRFHVNAPNLKPTIHQLTIRARHRFPV